MSDQFPLKPDAFSGGSRLTAAQRSEGPDGAPLSELLNEAARGADDASALTGSVDLSAATAAVVASANRGVSTNAGAARSLTLPDYASAPDGWEHTAIAFDASGFTVIHAGTDTINGIAGDVALAAAHQWVKVMKLSSASGWTAIGGTMVTPA
jgi:hypothetical protein